MPGLHKTIWKANRRSHKDELGYCLKTKYGPRLKAAKAESVPPDLKYRVFNVT